MEHAQIQTLHERVQALEEQEVARSKRPAETTPEATPPSQRRSSVASTELLGNVAEIKKFPMVSPRSI